MQDKELSQGQKKPYVKPELVTHGSVQELTQKKHDHGDDGKDRGGPGSQLFGW